ncbi:hypothetical protein GCM10027089_41990 [Nocardia thraciensis]
MVDAAVTRLREVAGPDLYRRNAFRVTGVATDAGRSAVRQRRQLVVAAVAAGADIDLGHGQVVNEPQVRAAFDVLLGDSRRRLADEVFWVWGRSEQICGCAPRVHRDHDAAVRAHSTALDAEADPEAPAARVAELWSRAARHWRQALRRTDFWEHLRYRADALDDRALDHSTVEALRDTVPATLVKPLVELALSAPDPARLIGIARDWPVPERVVDDLLEQATEPLYGRLDTVLDEAFGLLRENEFAAAATGAGDMAHDLRRLEILVPAERFRRTGALRDQTAVILNNCALAVLDGQDETLLDRAEGWMLTALELVVDAEIRHAITQNLAPVRQRAESRRLIERQRAERRRRAQQRRAEWRQEFEAIEQERRQRAERRRELWARFRQRWARSSSPGPALSGLRANLYLLSISAIGARRALITVIAGVVFTLGVVVVAAWQAGSEPETATVWAEHASANAAVGRCIGAETDWSATKTTVRVADCGRPHWGEVLGYPQLASSPSPYPGDDQVVALARFECGLRLSAQGLSAAVFESSRIDPDARVWNTGATHFENYATCVVHRRDDAPISGGQLVDPARRLPAYVRMSLFADSIALNPPVGSCVAEEREFSASVKDVAMVDCDVAHWAEVVGYPVLYEPGTPWPGDTATQDAASAACTRTRSVPKDFQLHVISPAGDWWNHPGSRKYATCLARRVDGKPFVGGVR